MSTSQTIFSIIRDSFRQLSAASLPLLSETARPAPAAMNAAVEHALRDLEKALGEDTNTQVSPGLCDYMFFPITPILKSWNRVPSRALANSLECVQIIYDHGWKFHGKPELYQQLSMLLVNICDGCVSPKEKIPQDSTVRIVALRLLHSLLRFEVNLSEKRDHLMFARCLSFLLDLLTNDSLDNDTTGAVLKCLQQLLFHCLHKTTDISYFLPGIISSLTRALSTKGSCVAFHHNLISAIHLFTDVVISCLSDDIQYQDEPEDDAQSKPEVSSSIRLQPRTKEWRKLSADQVSSAIQLVLCHRTSRNLSVQETVFETCYQLFSRCSASLPVCRTDLLETLLILQSTSTCTRIQMNGFDQLLNLKDVVDASALENGQLLLKNASFVQAPLSLDIRSLQSFWLCVSVMERTNEQHLRGRYADSFFDTASCTLRMVRSTEGETEERSVLTVLGLTLSLEYVSWYALQKRTDFRPQLMQLLYPLLSLLANGNNDIKASAEACVQTVAIACDYSSPGEMLQENIDYVVNSVAMKLNMLDIPPELPFVLRYIIQEDNGQCIPFLGDIIDSIFDILDSYHGYTQLTAVLLGVLFSVIQQASRPFQSNQNEDRLLAYAADSKRAHTGTQPCSELSDLVELLHKNPSYPIPKLDDAVSEEDIRSASETLHEQEPSIPSEEPSDTSSTAPAPADEVDKGENKNGTVAMVQRIVEKAQLFLSHQFAPIRLEMLKLVCSSIPILEQEKNTYYPTINTFWPLLLLRLDDEDPVVVLHALYAIQTVCFSASDFMTSRIEKDLLPKLCNLTRQHSLLRPQAAFGVPHKLQLAITSLAASCVANRLSLIAYMQIFNLAAPMLRQLLPADRQHAEHVWTCLARRNPDAVFWAQTFATDASFIDRFTASSPPTQYRRVQAPTTKQHSADLLHLEHPKPETFAATDRSATNDGASDTEFHIQLPFQAPRDRRPSKKANLIQIL
ncbi:tel Two Interacting protein 1 [Schizosaccharomyces japonicus yFS275]|uniref:Tel Two Interacting protein 1 n=1 Tax=Schizosaccharomyces japonicus (strain yFS275 / FY16936) TaxID=402676 RepID=B6K3S6_SCHJY|nr:tel Two Interacting protein 1 [Schizosaccharomyces japonicus yFS275]EEB08133.1 tel Two Interacting protein 1 [Schizosaccharomyces japonicus yFS275]